MDHHQKEFIHHTDNHNDDFYKQGVGIHSQVMKIKQEMETINRLALQLPEPRPESREIIRRRQRSRSPLGLAQRRISVGN